jgi:hypothetical protein
MGTALHFKAFGTYSSQCSLQELNNLKLLKICKDITPPNVGANVA